jgi:hypothetical protein
MYRFGPKNSALEARQRSLHNAGMLPAPPRGAPPGGPGIARAASRSRAARDPRETNFSDITLYGGPPVNKTPPPPETCLRFWAEVY